MDKPMSSPHLNVGDLVKLTPEGVARFLGGEDAVGIITRRYHHRGDLGQHLWPFFEITWLDGAPSGPWGGGPATAGWFKHWDGP